MVKRENKRLENRKNLTKTKSDNSSRNPNLRNAIRRGPQNISKESVEGKKEISVDVNKEFVVVARDLENVFEDLEVLSIKREQAIIVKTPRLPKTPKIDSMSRSSVQPNSPYNMSLGTRTPKINSVTRPDLKKSLNRPDPVLQIPNVGRSKSIRSVERSDPWIPQNIVSVKTKILNLNTFNEINLVPTSSVKLQNPFDYIPDDKHEPILIGDIYLDKKNSKGRDYHYVSRNMQSVTSQITTQNSILRSKYVTKYKNLIDTKGNVLSHIFDKCLRIYENNQLYYQECIDSAILSIEELEEGLTSLEHWFMLIIEPKEYAIMGIEDEEEKNDCIETWREREVNKLINGYSNYCDPELCKYVSPLSKEDKTKLKKYHKKINL